MGQCNRRKRFPMRIRVLLACGVVSASCLLAPEPTHAASRQAQERAARKACLSGDSAKGVSILSDLFVDTKDPTYIFNQGRCFEQNRRYEDAIARFQEYLRAGMHLTPSDKESAEKHIADCQDLLAKQTGQTAAAAAPASPIQAPVIQQTFAPLPLMATPTQGPVAVQQALPQPTRTTGSGLRTAGIITASAGGAAVIAGFIFNLKVNSMASDMETPGGYSDSKESQRKTYQTLGWVSYGVGAACVATGAILYILGLRSGSGSSASIALVPVFANDQAGALLKGAF